MSTPPPADTTDTLSLEEGPIADALHELGRAEAAVESAKAAVRAQRDALALVLRDQFAGAFATDESDAAHDVLRTLYWDHRNVRVTDLSTATGLSSSQLLQVVGPKEADVPCDRCGTTTTVLQPSRSGSRSALCPECRSVAALQEATAIFDGPFGRDDDGWYDPPLQGALEPPPLAPWPGVSADQLGALFEHLLVALQDQRCDNELTQTRRWARREGVDEALLVDLLQARGGFCDCEVLINVRG